MNYVTFPTASAGTSGCNELCCHMARAGKILVCREKGGSKGFGLVKN